MAAYETPEEEWAALLSGTHPHLQHASPFRFVPSSPRCKLCLAPFGSPGSLIFRRFGYAPWSKNPNICGRCFKNIEGAARACPVSGDHDIAGAEIELSMLFADVRGSSKIARQLPVLDFTRLMNRFYRVSSEVLFGADAVVEKFVGDEVVGLFIPFLAGPEHPARAVDAAIELLRATGHGAPEGPWVPLGAAVHTGKAFVGVVGSAEGTSDFTALGDPLNIAAHLASQAAIGEILVTTEAVSAASMPTSGLERRHLSLKDHPVDAVVLIPSGVEPSAGKG
ncbi:MAG TPA: adenylate/guanylate cyclase domain-containing protein [Actinomycetota bacterium]|jgi:adenylate cyclase|nr:adenylate/guanylate cyclase domain-containing protein [Actinomycetota bacterium]